MKRGKVTDQFNRRSPRSPRSLLQSTGEGGWRELEGRVQTRMEFYRYLCRLCARQVYLNPGILETDFYRPSAEGPAVEGGGGWRAEKWILERGRRAH